MQCAKHQSSRHPRDGYRPTGGHARAVQQGEVWALELPGDLIGTRYGYRAHGAYEPHHNLWFDPAKLLVDPYALQLDRRFTQHPRLAQYGEDTADIVPRAIVAGPLPHVPPAPPLFQRGGLIYELNVAGFTKLHPDVPEGLRGTIAALAHPAVIAHLKKLHVNAVELMPIIAWRLKPSFIGSVTATTCMTPDSVSFCTRWRTAASESPTTLPISE